MHFFNGRPVRLTAGLQKFLVLFITVIPLIFLSTNAWALSALEAEAAASINRISIIMNGLIRIAAIGAGVYIVWMGHNTMIRGIKGEFEFEGEFGKLKGSTPGLLFVLLGSLVIGWSLQTTASGEFGAKEEAGATDSVNADNDRLSNKAPPFLKNSPGIGENGNDDIGNK